MSKYTWTPENSSFLAESSIHPHVAKEKSHLFEAADNCSTEYEVLNWLHATIRVFKPELILETGAWDGLGTIAIADACKANGFGKVHSLEIDPSQCVRVEQVIEEQHLKQWVDVHQTNSLEWLSATNLVFDIGFFDSLTEIRAEEAAICLDRKLLRKMAVFHDTSPYRSESAPDLTPPEVQKNYREKVFSLTRHPRCTGFFDSHLSRGFMVLFFDESKM